MYEIFNGIPVVPGQARAKVSSEKPFKPTEEPIECATSALPKPSFFCAPAFAVPSGGGVLVVADCVSVVCRCW